VHRATVGAVAMLRTRSTGTSHPPLSLLGLRGTRSFPPPATAPARSRVRRSRRVFHLLLFRIDLSSCDCRWSCFRLHLLPVLHASGRRRRSPCSRPSCTLAPFALLGFSRPAAAGLGLIIALLSVPASDAVIAGGTTPVTPELTT
jgi:hypothetical protein